MNLIGKWLTWLIDCNTILPHTSLGYKTLVSMLYNEGQKVPYVVDGDKNFLKIKFYIIISSHIFI